MNDNVAEQSVLEVKKLSIGHVVDSLNFSLERGQTLALVGESGCGKSLTALSLMRLAPFPVTGSISLQGHDLLSLSERQMRKVRGRRMAMIFQDPMSALNPVYTVGAQLQEVVDLHGASTSAIQALRDVGISSPEQRINEYPHQLSGGMRQRIMIAMALLCEPEVLIADEPTTALDVTTQAQILALMRDLQQRKGTAILFITHDMGVVAEIADEVLVMYAGRAVEQGPVGTLFDSMAHPYTQGLFAARPRAGEPLETIPGQVPPATAWPSGCRFHPRCPHAMECCKSGPVPSIAHSEDHAVHCWLYSQEAPCSSK